MAEGKVTRRLGSELEFDTAKEKDIVEAIDRLASSKKLGHLVSHLLRLAFESPEIYGNGQEVRQLVEKMMTYGMSPTRYTFFSQVTKEMELMKKKIDDIYEMAYKTYMLAEAGKRVGLTERADNNLRSTFMLQRQVESLCSTLGVDNLNHSFISNKLEDTHKRAEDVLEYMINSYDGIIEEIKSAIEYEVKGNIEIPVIQGASVVQSISNNQLNTAVSSSTTTANRQSENNIDDEIPDLVEKPNDNRIVAPSGEMAKQFQSWFNED